MPAEKVTGRGTNISDEKLRHKINNDTILAKSITSEQCERAKAEMKERFMALSMPHHALGALEEIAVRLAGEFGTINIKENIPLNKNWLKNIGIYDEKYLINWKKLPHLSEILTRASLYILNRMKSFDEAEVL